MINRSDEGDTWEEVIDTQYEDHVVQSGACIINREDLTKENLGSVNIGGVNTINMLFRSNYAGLMTGLDKFRLAGHIEITDITIR